MKARWIRIVPVIVLLLGASAAAAFWLFWTPGGASWLVRAAIRLAPVPIQVGGVSGRLVDGLRLSSIEARWPSGTATVDSFRFRLRPFSLLRGAVSVDSLAVEGASVTLREAGDERRGAAPAPPPELRWPAVTGIAARLDGRIDSLRLSGIRIRTPGREPVTLEEVSARITWKEGVLAVTDLAATSPSARLEGALAAGFVRPSLRAELSIRLPDAAEGMERVSLLADLVPAPSPGGLAGPLEISATFSDSRGIRIEGDAAIETNKAMLRDLSLSLPEQPGVVTGRAGVVLSRGRVNAELILALHRLDLFPATGTHTEISGDLELSGGPGGYEGSFSLANPGKGIHGIRLRGAIAGDSQHVSLPRLRGGWLGGEVAGTMTLSWREGLHLDGSLEGRKLDPARIDPAWPGRINFALRGWARKEGSSPLHAEVDLRLLESTLRERALVGEARAGVDERGLRIAGMELHGDGFDVSVSGSLRERLVFSADIPRLEGLLPGAAGNVEATGWVRWRDGPAGGALTARGEDLSLPDVRVDSLSVSMTWEGTDHPFTVEGKVGGVSAGGIRLETAALGADGTPEEHDLRVSLRWAAGDGSGHARGSYRSGTWEGTVAALSGRGKEGGSWSLTEPAPVAVSADAVRISPFRVAGTGGESLEAEADLSLRPLRGSAKAEWEKVDPALANPWLEGLRLSGTSSGNARMAWPQDGAPALALRITAEARILQGERELLEVQRARLALEAGEGGTRASLEAVLGGGGTVTGSFLAGEPATAGIPQHGTLQVSWQSVDLALVSPWFPQGVTLSGTLSGQAEGEMLAGGKFDVRGEVRAGEAKLLWNAQGKAIEAPLRSAEMRWSWREDAARGEFSLSLEEYGRARGNFRLPLPAKLPLGMQPKGEVSAALSAAFREKGLLHALFPGMVQETSGAIGLELRVGGTWELPDLEGTMTLAEAGAYLPAAGIHLSRLEAKGTLSGREIRIETLKARSGEGSIEATATVLLADWKLAGYRATLKGENVRTVDLPELRMVASPDLRIEGTTERLQVRGELAIPELLVYGRQTPPPVRRSDDVVIVDAGEAAGEEPPLSLDIQVKVVLGKHVLVKAEGIDARLEGAVTIRSEPENGFTAQGEIRVADGRYSTHGVRLQITRGRLLFAGGPVERPALDILATRKAGDVTAGVQVTGTPRQPLVKLYSEPSMPDTDVLSYIVLGRPLGQQGEQADALMLAAGALLPMAESAVLRDRLSRHFGIDVLEVRTGEDAEAGSAITVGKYLNPKLYVSYGRSIFTGVSEVTVRYDFLKRWQIESQFGEESGIDLFYKIEFR